MTGLDETAHSHHRPWRRWKVTRAGVRILGRLGIVAAWSYTYGFYCRGCLDYIEWRPSYRRSYVLGWPTDKWRCLLVKHHWPTEPVGLGLCAKCLPCEVCGSTEWPHAYECEVTL